MSIFLQTNHLFLRAPDGGVEDVASMKAAGFGAIFCNIGDYPPDSWQTIRNQARNAGVVCGPWLRTNTPSNMFSIDKLDFLIATADIWNAPLIVNSESELKGSGNKLTLRISEKLEKRDAAISVEAWPFADVEWWPLGEFPILVQIFPQESGAGGQPEACRSQWYAYGVKCVVYTFGSYWGWDPNSFDRLTPYGVYTADDCGGVFQAWNPKGERDPCQSVLLPIKPKPPEEEFMADIGTQHGITAFVDWLQKQPSVPKRGLSYNKDDLSTWPWAEKLERTLNMLREDHDKQN
jgi:hypothetical protein